MSFDGAILDFDGVIIDSRTPVRTAVNSALVSHGFPARDSTELDRFIGPPAPAAFAELTGEPRESDAVAACVGTYHREYERLYLTQTTLIDGIAAALEAIDLPLALATAKQAKFTQPLLERLGLARRFDPVCAPGNDALGEAKTTLVARALRKLAVRHPVVVGDRCFDIEAAHTNGLPAFGVTWGIGDRAELERAGADVILNDPRELPLVLANGAGGRQ